MLSDLHAIVLAAGESRRLGRPKQLLRFEGSTLIERAIRQAKAICDGRVTVVVGAHRDQILPLVEAVDVNVAINSEWATGMSSSLRAGIESLPAHSAAAMLTLCDHPLVTVAQLTQLAEAWASDPDRAAASAYNGTIGVPAIVPRRLYPNLLSLSGDAGAKLVLMQELRRLITLAIPEASLDVDTEETASELARLESRGKPS
jgi:molybdenum cofactor cytidylyltransferase